jgi:hypothetical protein
MTKSSARERNGASEMPTQPIAVAYFNRTRPVPIEHYLHREKSDGFFPLMVAAAFIAAAVLLLLD